MTNKARVQALYPFARCRPVLPGKTAWYVRDERSWTRFTLDMQTPQIAWEEAYKLLKARGELLNA